MIPSDLHRLILDKLKTPYAIFEFFKAFLQDDALKFTYSMNKKQFIPLCYKHLKIESSDSFDLEQIFKIFAVRPAQAMTGRRIKLINALEFLTALILLADFGESSNSDLQHNAELIEHKINLMLILFDLRQQSKINIAEVIIMLRTSLQALSKVFPSVSFFKNQTVQSEIKENMMNLFREKLEQGVAEMHGLGEAQAKEDQKVQDVDMNEASNFLGFMQAQKSGPLGSSQSSPSFMNISTEVSSGDEDINNQMYVPKGISAMQRHIHESVAEKKRRLFKWNDYEKVMLPLDLVKD